MTLGHDTLLAALLLIAGVLAMGYATTTTQTWRTLSLVGACVTIIIGMLLLFGLA